MTAIKGMRKEYPNANKIVIVTPDDGAVPFLIPKVKRMLEISGCTVVGDTIKFPNQMEDFSPIAVKINAVKDADAVTHYTRRACCIRSHNQGLAGLGERETDNHQCYYQPGRDFCDLRAGSRKQYTHRGHDAPCRGQSAADRRDL